MELQTENRIYRETTLHGFVKFGLLLVAKHLVRATKESAETQREILYDLPGVFSMSLSVGNTAVRLIKEADELRIMKRSERSATLLEMVFTDYAALGDLVTREVTLSKLLSENRLRYAGAPKHFGVIARAIREGDKLALSDEKFAENYGKNK